MKLFRLIHYLKHLLKANTLHGTHSPFIYNFIKQVFYNSSPKAPAIIEVIRRDLEKNKSLLTPSFPGSNQKENKQLIKDTAARSSVSRKNGSLLFRIICYINPINTLELGTCFGLSTIYLATAGKGTVHTVEGDNERAWIAQENFNKAGLLNIKMFKGSFDQILPSILEEIKSLDLVFIDGNHRYEPTINYFKQCLEKSSDETVFIFDDIYWSNEMKKAWEEIKRTEKVTITIDTFYFGIVFLRKGQAKEHFRIKY